jgi:hypothetical protein
MRSAGGSVTCLAVQPRSNKRQKELARLERRKEKDERREQRKRERAERVVPEGEDPDIAGIVPGPQPRVDEDEQESGS